MTTPCNSGYQEVARFLAGEAADIFKYIAVGKGTGQGAVDKKLKDECTEDGLKRVAATTCKTVKTIIDNDTHRLIKEFTAGETATVTEAGAFNDVDINEGDMLMVGDLSPIAPMIKDDTLTLTLNTQVKTA